MNYATTQWANVVSLRDYKRTNGDFSWANDNFKPWSFQSVSERLNSREIVILRSLMKRGATAAAVSLAKWQRKFVVSLWRRDLVEIWYRQSPATDPALQGPYYRLTIAGARLADALFPAPRGFSGAEQSK